MNLHKNKFKLMTKVNSFSILTYVTTKHNQEVLLWNKLVYKISKTML